MRHEQRWIEFKDAQGRFCKVYAERLIPDGTNLPAILHCVGGGQVVSRADLEFWAQRGYACASFDWQIGEIAHRAPATQSKWPTGVLHQSAPITCLDQAILPLAAQAGSRVMDWLAEDSCVRADAFGLSGISWGGYLSWLIAALDPRVSCTVAVYGCGIFHALRPVDLPAPIAHHWQSNWDPQALAAKQRAPACFLSASNDFFGPMDHAWTLLNQLNVPFRASFLPNADHAMGDSERALAAAWMAHHLRGAKAPPQTPELTQDFNIELDDTESVLRTEVWWTRQNQLDRFACWHPGCPPHHEARAAFGKVVYRSGISLCSPLLRLDAPAPAALPDQWPDLRAGLGWRWDLGSVGLNGADPVVDMLSGDPTQLRITPAPGAADAPIALLLHQFSDPAWPWKQSTTLTFGLQPESGTIGEVRAVGMFQDDAGIHEAPIKCTQMHGHYQVNLPTRPEQGRLRSIRLEVAPPRPLSFHFGPLRFV